VRDVEWLDHYFCVGIQRPQFPELIFDRLLGKLLFDEIRSGPSIVYALRVDVERVLCSVQSRETQERQRQKNPRGFSDVPLHASADLEREKLFGGRFYPQREVITTAARGREQGLPWFAPRHD
jgi:hypothetical protein